MSAGKATFGIQIAFSHTPEQVLAQALRAEQLGFDSVWLGEHLFTPTKRAWSDPFGTPDSPLDSIVECSDSMITIGAISASTQRLGINTAVYLLALRHPLVAARAIATIQRLSGERFQLGVGVGRVNEEYEAVGVPFGERGSRLNEGISILRKALAGGAFEHRGKHYQFESLSVVSRPISLTVLIGGSSEPALRRAALLGDGWCAPPERTLDQIVDFRERIEALREDYGTSGRSFAYYVRLPDATSSSVETYIEAGFKNITVGGSQVSKWTDPLQHKLAVMENLARELALAPVLN